MIGLIKKNLIGMYQLSEFEAARQKATFCDDLPPDASALDRLLNTFRSQDPETKADVGFYTIMTKMEASDNRRKWKYQLKNMLVLDYVVEDKLYLDQISQISLRVVDSLKIKHKHSAMGLQSLLYHYQNYIQAKAKVYLQHHNNLIERLKLQDLVMKAIESGQQGYLKYKLCQYLYSRLASFSYQNLLECQSLLNDTVHAPALANAQMAFSLDFLKKYNFITVLNEIHFVPTPLESLMKQLHKNEQSSEQVLVISVDKPPLRLSKYSPDDTSKYQAQQQMMQQFQAKRRFKKRQIKDRLCAKQEDALYFLKYQNTYSEEQGTQWREEPRLPQLSFNLNLESMVEYKGGVAPRDRLTIVDRAVFIREHQFKEEIFSGLKSIYLEA